MKNSDIIWEIVQFKQVPVGHTITFYEGKDFSTVAPKYFSLVNSGFSSIRWEYSKLVMSLLDYRDPY